jgi:hypothetical protein
MPPSDIKKFNDLLDEFIEKMITAFDSEKLRTYRRSFIMLKETSPIIPVNLFMAGCINYKNEISTRNDIFFLKDKQIAERAKLFGGFTDDCGIDVYWKELSSKTKTAIWDYIQSLYVLAEIIVNKNQKIYDKYKNMYATDYKTEISNLNNGEFSVDFLNKINS